MSWFPLFVNLSGQKCVIAGGGKVALHKAERLLPCGAQVTVISPRIDTAFQSLPVTVMQRAVMPSDTEGAALVIDATGNRSVSEMLFSACQERHIPFNAVDTPDLCSVIFPAVLRRGKLTAGISTGGASPLAAAWIRDRLGEAIPDGFEDILAQMEALRLRAKNTVPDQPRRAALLRSCFTAAVEQGRPLWEEEINALWNMSLSTVPPMPRTGAGESENSG